MCGGFTCSKNALTALNILYILVAFILIGVAVYGRASAIVTNLPIIGGILACGVFLILISILGLIGAIKHHQVLLFFYMLILFLLFLVQFSVACACLAFDAKQQYQLAKQGWSTVSPDIKNKVEKTFDCCELDNKSNSVMTTTSVPQYECQRSCCSRDDKGGCHCQSCMEKLQTTINYAFKLCGGIGLFFSFTEVVAAVIAYRYRNQIDPDNKAASAIINRHHSYRIY